MELKILNKNSKKPQRKQPNGRGGGSKCHKQNSWKRKPNIPLLFNMISSQITPEKARTQRSGREKWGQRDRGNRETAVKKESIFIQLIWLFTDNQTKTLLILTLPSTIYTLVPLPIFSFISTHTKMPSIPPSKTTCNTRLPGNTDKGTSWMCSCTVTYARTGKYTHGYTQ